MNFQQLNECLSDIQKLRSTKIKTEEIHKVDGETQGDEGVSYEICPLPHDGLFVRLKITTDSYGDRESVSGIEIVKPFLEEITKYEPVK